MYSGRFPAIFLGFRGAVRLFSSSCALIFVLLCVDSRRFVRCLRVFSRLGDLGFSCCCALISVGLCVLFRRAVRCLRVSP